MRFSASPKKSWGASAPKPFTTTCCRWQRNFIPSTCIRWSTRMSLETLSVVEAANSIRNGSLSPLEYVQALLARVDAVEPRVQAWTTIDRDAVLAEARQLETDARKKQFRGPLHGIPVGIKDIF